MLLVPCPYCGAAPGDRVPLRRRGAHRAARPGAPPATRTGREYLYYRTNPKGAAPRALVPPPWLRPLVQRAARHGQRPVPRPAYEAAAERAHDDAVPPRRAAAGSIAAAPLRFSFDGRSYRRLRRRHAGLGAARQRRPSGRPQLQVPPPARHHDRRRRGAQRADPARAAGGPQRSQPARHRARALRRPDRRAARTAGRRSASTSARVNDLLSPLLPAGFYYKTFLWPARLVAARSTSRSSAAPPASAGRPTRPDPDRYLHRHAHCDVLVVGAGPAGLMAALAAGRSGARVILCRARAGLGGSLLARAARSPSSTACAGDAWLRRGRWRELDAHARGHRPAAAPPPSAISTTTIWRWPSASPTTCRCRRRTSRAQRLWRVRARQVVLAHRRHRAAAGVRRQRPARHHAGRAPRAPISTATASRRAAGPCWSPTTTAPTPPRSIWPGPASRSRRSSTCARHADGDAAEAAAATGLPILRGCGRGRDRRPAPAASRPGSSPLRRTAAVDRRSRRPCLRLPADVRRLEPDRASVLAVARQAALRRRRRPRSCPAQSVQAERSAGACQR